MEPNETDWPVLGEFVTRRSAAKRAGIGERQIRAATAAGEIPLYQVGAWPRVRYRDVLAWIERQHVAPASVESRAHVERRVREVLAREGGPKHK